jgi:hypothetical protein
LEALKRSMTLVVLSDELGVDQTRAPELHNAICGRMHP